MLLFNHLSLNSDPKQKRQLLKKRMKALFPLSTVDYFTFGINESCIYTKPFPSHH